MPDRDVTGSWLDVDEPYVSLPAVPPREAGLSHRATRDFWHQEYTQLNSFRVAKNDARAPIKAVHPHLLADLTHKMTCENAGKFSGLIN